jgi:hypothetical protein
LFSAKAVRNYVEVGADVVGQEEQAEEGEREEGEREEGVGVGVGVGAGVGADGGLVQSRSRPISLKNRRLWGSKNW